MERRLLGSSRIYFPHVGRVLVLVAAVSTVSANARADDVYWSTKTLLSEFFKDSERVSYVKLETAAAAEDLRAMLGYTPKKSTYPVFIARTGDRIDGYAVIDEELGQHLPITFGVKLNASGEVEQMEVMVYREGYGD